MPGFLGGGGGGSTGTGGEISFPKEFVDPVTKLRVSNPENLIDTDFEYGLQPTKWETIELINNTPSFFSKSGDTTIPDILSIKTNAGTSEITVVTAKPHGLTSGIPISVVGTKVVTADGSYIIGSIPNPNTFTYICRDNQATTQGIEDLYTSIITGEFFQGSQLRIADSEGIVTDAAGESVLTVKTESPHGFGINSPFYFLNLNSTISQEFESTNTSARSFDSSNSATAQTFDGSNTLSTFSIDWSNSGTTGGVTSEVVGTNTTNDTIQVAHSTENFNNLKIGAPLYYDVDASLGYFSTRPRGVVFLKTNDQVGTSSSTFQVSAVPNGDAINIQSSMTGTFQSSNQSRLFAGNNSNPDTQTVLDLTSDDAVVFEGANDASEFGNGVSTVTSFSGSLVNVSVSEGAGLDYYPGAMLRYTASSAASGLVANATYFVDSFFSTGTDTFAFTLRPTPTANAITSISGGIGPHVFTRIGVSVDRNIFHFRDSNYAVRDMLEYTFPSGGSVAVDSAKTYFFVNTAFPDGHNYQLDDKPFLAFPGQAQFTTPGTFSWTAPANVYEVCAVAIGGGGGGSQSTNAGSGAGGGGLGWRNRIQVTPGTSYTVVVGAGGTRPATTTVGSGGNGGQSYFITPTGPTGVAGNGGAAALDNNTSTPAGGTFVGEGGGNGGAGGQRISTAAAGGGGGAGGYTGAGGRGGGAAGGPTAGTGGGAGGGGQSGSVGTAGSGGGVGIFGAGANGAAGLVNTDGKGGGGGSGGTNGAFFGSGTASVYGSGTFNTPGNFGGGAGASDIAGNEISAGGGGAVRIIWGEGRAFPATRTANE
jgi:hypothetical protein